jgi:uncharacterized protein YacL
VIVEAIRLLVTLATTAVGFTIGKAWLEWFPGSGADPDFSVITGAVVGAGVGYVVGGVLGRVIRRGLDAAPKAFARATGPQLFAGTFGLIVGLMLGVVVGTPMVVLLPAIVGWPLAGLGVLVLSAFGARLFSARSTELLAVTGLRPRDPLQRKTVVEETAVRPRYLLDSSAAIDGRILELARASLVAGDVWVPAFVVDELQAIADASDKNRRRRGRRGLDMLDALRDVPAISFVVLEESVPEHPEVDAKLLALAARLDVSLVTTDHNLARAAGLRGITVVNPHALGESLRPTLMSGDLLRVTIEKSGSEPGQGVGFLDDGTMVVVAGAASSIGSTLDVEVSNMLRTSVGRMVFARPSQ